MEKELILEHHWVGLGYELWSIFQENHLDVGKDLHEVLHERWRASEWCQDQSYNGQGFEEFECMKMEYNDGIGSQISGFIDDERR